MASRKRKNLKKLAKQAGESQRALLGNQAEDYTILAAETTDPDVKAGAEQLARLSNRNMTERSIMEALQDPDSIPTAQTRRARDARQKRFPNE